MFDNYFKKKKISKKKNKKTYLSTKNYYLIFEFVFLLEHEWKLIYIKCDARISHPYQA